MFIPGELKQGVRLFRERFRESLTGIALFGSTARGDAHLNSDWDILIIAENLPANQYERQMFLRALLPVEMGTKVSVMGKTKEEFEQRLLPVYLDIAADGIILFDPHKYLRKKFSEVKKILQEEGLIRKKLHNTWVWTWEKPKGRDWEIEWYEVRKNLSRKDAKSQ